MTFQLGHVTAPCGSNTSTSLYFRHDEKIFLSSLIVLTFNQSNYSEKYLCCNSPLPPFGPAGVFHPEWEADGSTGDGGPSRRPLPHRGDAEQRREGQGGSASPQRLSRLKLPHDFSACSSPEHAPFSCAHAHLICFLHFHLKAFLFDGVSRDTLAPPESRRLRLFTS